MLALLSIFWALKRDQALFSALFIKRAHALLSAPNIDINIGNIFSHENIDIFSERKAKTSTKNEWEWTQKKRTLNTSGVCVCVRSSI